MRGASLNHLIGAQQERLRDSQPKRLGGGQIDDEIELGRLLNGNVARLRPAQNLVDEFAGAPKQRGQVWAVGHQRAYFNVFAKTAYRCYPCTQRQGADANPVGIDERVADHVECLGVAPHRFKARSNVVHSADFDFDCVETEASRRRVGLLQFDERWRVSRAESVDRPTGWPRSDQRDRPRRVILGSRKQNVLRGEQHANNRWRGETRTRGRAAEQRYEPAAAGHSITSSAIASSPGGKLRPNARPVYTPAWRYASVMLVP